MIVNGDFDKRTTVHGSKEDWIPSPLAGVDRCMLDRIGAEVARATSIVRYAPGSNFSPHVHTGGEEFLVLDGVFQDEHADYPAGSYVRNPPESFHTPRSDDGCTILVKLWQFDLADRTGVNIDTGKAKFIEDHKNSAVERLSLFTDKREVVEMIKLAPYANLKFEALRGMEIFVFAGGFTEAGETFEKWSWLRLPCGHAGSLVAGESGALLWTKRGHLHGEICGPEE